VLDAIEELGRPGTVGEVGAALGVTSVDSAVLTLSTHPPDGILRRVSGMQPFADLVPTGRRQRHDVHMGEEEQDAARP
jgi:hypothetical protein